ncbi:hypothetical protein EVJ50_03860 [Synechococcus sp. RSCCF101]|uniref:hypothetical protein n=1 Tax=Synechococcus sp. RSCCF101 TaxID=2511069 RepID=UPI001245444C|nr:hypothetical protein [Synechococcus sp. RSCCF101]QEY31512.1 hypothetical protein EVJ50_03860 [Synechococcus sp. RSCCF101]
MKRGWLLAPLLAGALLAGGWWALASVRGRRPPPPPEGSPIVYPWGAMNLDTDNDEPESDLERSIRESFQSEAKGRFDQDGDGDNDYAVLVLSGGGSAGAFGANAGRSEITGPV